MEALAFILLGVIMWIHAWQLVGVSNPRTTGVLSLAAGAALIGAAIFKPVDVLGAATTMAPATALAMLFGIYGVLVAAIGLWDFDPRALGLYALFFAIGMLLYSGYFASVAASTAAAGIAFVIAIPFVLLFFYLTPPIEGLRKVTGYTMLVAAVLVAIAGFAPFLGILTL